MGRNSGSKIFWTDMHDGATNSTTYYCQQHAMWAQEAGHAKLKDHIDGDTNQHGNVDVTP